MAIIEWKPVTSQVDSVADYYTGALAASLAAQQAFKDTGDNLSKAYTNTQKGNLIRDLISGYDPNDLQSYNKSLALAGSTYYGIDPDMLERLHGDYRTKMNKQLDVDNLNINKQLMAEAQARINEAQANADIRGLKSANSAATQMVDANGNAVRTDAYTLGQVDPLLNSASQRALQAARTQAARQQAQMELNEKNATNFITNGGNSIARQMPPSLIGTAEGNQLAYNYAMELAKDAPPEARAGVVERLVAQYQKTAAWMTESGIDTSMLGTPDPNFTYQIYDSNGNIRTVAVNPNYANSVLGRIEAAAASEAARQADAQAVAQRDRELGDTFFNDTLAALDRGNYELATSLLDTYKADTSINTPERVKILEDSMELAKLDARIKAQQEAIAANPPETKPLDTISNAMIMAGISPQFNPFGGFAAATLTPQDPNPELTALMADREKLQQRIKQQREALEDRAKVDRLTEIVKSGDVSVDAQNEVATQVQEANTKTSIANATALRALANMIDPDHTQTGANSVVEPILAAMTVRDGKMPEEAFKLPDYRTNDGNALDLTDPYKVSGKEVAEAFKNRYNNLSGNQQLRDNELEQIRREYPKVVQRIADTLQANSNFKGKAQDAQRFAANIAIRLIESAIEDNSGITSWFDDNDFIPEDLQKNLRAVENILNNKDPVFNSIIQNAAQSSVYLEQVTAAAADFQQRQARAEKLRRGEATRATAQQLLGQQQQIVPGAGLVVGNNLRASGNTMVEQLNRFNR